MTASAGLLYRKWKDLADCLGVDPDAILSIEKRFLNSSHVNPSYEPVIYEVLHNWQSREVQNASLSTLLTALNQIGLEKTAEKLNQNAAHWTTVHTKGAITYDILAELGSSTNMVYKGRVENKPVAVKLILCKNQEDMKIKLKEVDRMMRCNGNDNVIKYLKKATDIHFIYIAMELCNGSLQQWLDEEIEKIDKTSISPVEILRQTTNGLMYLHRKELVHRDIKPQNILLMYRSNNVQVKIADLGISKVLTSGVSTEPNLTGTGTPGWTAPEILKAKLPGGGSMSKSADIFSLGLLFFYVLTEGHHPFGDDHISRDKNILSNTIADVDRFLPNYILETPDWVSLLKQMIMIDPKSRPSAEKILSKRKLWNCTKADSVTQSQLQNLATPETNSLIRAVGDISYDTSKPLSTNSNVFEGSFQRQTVAVKKLYCGDELAFKAREKEIHILLECNSYENIVKYFTAERNRDFIYVALELCSRSLWQCIENKDSHIQDSEIITMDILLQTTKGLAELHSHGIIHRDLNPKNVLLYRHSDRNVVAKISDFGISKVLPDDKDTLTITRPLGTAGWKAPEILSFHSETPKKMSTQTDIFSLGCLYYYVLSGGLHPFGENYERDLNIMGYKITGKDTDLPTIVRGNFWLILEMIKQTPFDRPSANDILFHNIFWSKKKSLDFIVHVAKLLRNHKTRGIEKCIRDLKNKFETETAWKRIVGSKTWVEITSIDIQMYLEELLKDYRGHHVGTLLRSIQHMWTHYGNLPDNVKMAFGNDSDSFYDYWVSIFPYLVSTVWIVFQHLKPHTHAYNLNPYYGNSFLFTIPQIGNLM